MTYQLISNVESRNEYVFHTQVGRAALSIPSNIAEGSSRRSEKEYVRFLEIALGSSFELETQLEIMLELKLVDNQATVELIELVNQVQRMLYGLMNAIPTDSR